MKDILKTTDIITHAGVSFKYRIYDTFAFWQDAIRVVFPWVWLNSIFDPEDEAMVIKEIIPSYIELKQEETKTATLQIRLKISDKEQLYKLASNSNLSVSDFLIKKAFA